MGFVPSKFLATTAIGAVCVAVYLASGWMRPAHADATQINQLPPTVAGTYFYPLDATGKHFTPGYFYAPKTGSVRFLIDAPAGTTLHLFDDAAGTRALRLPETLRQAGQTVPQSMPLVTGTFSCTQAGEVYLTQGWHKCYLEYKVAQSLPRDPMRLYSNRNGSTNGFTIDVSEMERHAHPYIRMQYSSGVLYDAVQSVSSACQCEPWKLKADGGLRCTGETIVTLPDGSPAAYDKIVARIAKVTRDLDGKQILTYINPTTGASLPLLSIRSSGRTDAAGKVKFTVEWDGAMPNTPKPSKSQSKNRSRPQHSAYSSIDPLGYVWMEFVDTSRNDLNQKGQPAKPDANGKGTTLKIGPMYTPFLVN